MQIGSNEFISMAGDVPGYGAEVLTTERAGVDGYTFVLQGKRGEPFAVTTRQKASSLDAAEILKRDYATLRGEFTTLVDTAGESYDKIMVLKVTAHIRPVMAATDESCTHVVEAQWQLIRAG